jgi:hypothetical protein
MQHNTLLCMQSNACRKHLLHVDSWLLMFCVKRLTSSMMRSGVKLLTSSTHLLRRSLQWLTAVPC